MSDTLGRPDDWPEIEPVDPEEGRELARWFQWSAGAWEAAGDHEAARRGERLGDAMLAEVEAVESGDEAAWVAAIAAQGRAIRPQGME